MNEPRAGCVPCVEGRPHDPHPTNSIQGGCPLHSDPANPRQGLCTCHSKPQEVPPGECCPKCVNSGEGHYYNPTRILACPCHSKPQDIQPEWDEFYRLTETMDGQERPKLRLWIEKKFQDHKQKILDGLENCSFKVELFAYDPEVVELSEARKVVENTI